MKYFDKKIAYEAVPFFATTIIVTTSFMGRYGETIKNDNFSVSVMLQNFFALNNVDKLSNTIIIISYLCLLIVTTYRLIDSIREFKNINKREPCGFYYSKISPVSTRNDVQIADEYSLIEVYRVNSHKLCYRGINKNTESQEIDFWWNCLDAWVQPISMDEPKLYRFLFHTDWQQIFRGKNCVAPPDISNLGYVNYHLNGERVTSAQGSFFDFSVSGNHVQRKQLVFDDASSSLNDQDITDFNEFFKQPRNIENIQKAIEILKKVEQNF